MLAPVCSVCGPVCLCVCKKKRLDMFYDALEVWYSITDVNKPHLSTYVILFQISVWLLQTSEAM